MHDGSEWFPQSPAALAAEGQWVMRTIVCDGLFSRQNLFDDGNVLSGACQRLGEGATVPSLNNLRSRDTQAQNHAAVRQVIHGQSCHGHGRWRPCGNLTDTSTQADGTGLSANPRQWRNGIAAIGFCSPDRVVS